MTAPPESTLRAQLLRLLHERPGRGLSLDFICQQLEASHSRQQVRDSIKALVKDGALLRQGSTRFPLYQIVAPAGQPGTVLISGRRLVHWPDGLQVQHLPTHEHWRQDFAGMDWSNSVQRPGCQDHLLIPSRRGDQLIAHRGPLGIQEGRRRP